MTVAFMALLAGVSATHAQEQEGKLVDRILKPNLASANPAQNKKIVATGTNVNKTAPSKTFYAPDNARPKTFTGDRAFSARQFAARHFRAGHSAADISTRSHLTRHDTIYPAPSAYPARVASGSDTAVATPSFAGNRPFLVEGKSQKALRAQNKPLTVEQVRELLNKNK